MRSAQCGEMPGSLEHFTIHQIQNDIGCDNLILNYVASFDSQILCLGILHRCVFKNYKKNGIEVAKESQKD